MIREHIRKYEGGYALIGNTIIKRRGRTMLNYLGRGVDKQSELEKLFLIDFSRPNQNIKKLGLSIFILFLFSKKLSILMTKIETTEKLAMIRI